VGQSLESEGFQEGCGTCGPKSPKIGGRMQKQLDSDHHASVAGVTSCDPNEGHLAQEEWPFSMGTAFGACCLFLCI
jgi:hypothetical protein